jgi:hypothetical protein
MVIELRCDLNFNISTFLHLLNNNSRPALRYWEFDEYDRMKPSAFYERVLDVMEDLVEFTVLTRDVAPHLVDRYSERRETAGTLQARQFTLNLNNRRISCLYPCHRP